MSTNITKENIVTLDDLPMTFQVKYLGQHTARGLWGIKHTRAPVDYLVKTAKNLPNDVVLPLIKIVISTEGIKLLRHIDRYKEDITTYSIENISYGVQDLVYTRVFCMIVVNDQVDPKYRSPFDCHAFVCDSRDSARKLTYALAAAFQEYSKKVQEDNNQTNKTSQNSSSILEKFEANISSPIIPRKFAIDLRTPEEMQCEMETEA